MPESTQIGVCAADLRPSIPPDDVPPYIHTEVSLSHQIGPLSLEIAFQLAKPWSIIFAPSGAGKTTILRAIAGLLKPQQSRILTRAQIPLQDDRKMTLELVMTDTSAAIFIPPHKRSVRLVAQSAALFPHLSVLENVRYKLFDYARTREEGHASEERLQMLLALCRVDHLTAKMPAQLSGGERQRVALARSLAPPDCNLLLLDEPFTGLDAHLRDELIADLRVWLARRNIPVLSVTHDIGEAFLLGAEVIRLHEGRVLQQGPVAEVLAAERARLLTQLG